MHSWSTFGVQMNHEHTQIHKTHHDSDMGETTTFPLRTFFVINHKGCIQMSFFFGTSKLGVLKLLKLGFLAFLEGHNFLCKPSIEVKSKAKL